MLLDEVENEVITVLEDVKTVLLAVEGTEVLLLAVIQIEVELVATIEEGELLEDDVETEEVP